MYSVIGILIARLLFPNNPSLVSVAFTSLLLLPSLSKIFSLETRQQAREKRFSFRKLIYDEYDFVGVYLMLMLGVFVTYLLAAVVLPNFEVNSLFAAQLTTGDIAGFATFNSGLFSLILLNNFFVLLACFLLSLLTGDGGSFLLIWNASLWGSVFGITAKNAAFYLGQNPFFVIFMILLVVFPHALLEMFSYILGAISGGIISKSFQHGIVQKKNELFMYNFWTFFIAFAVLIIAALVETFVLQNASTYASIAHLARFGP
ncbi:MAG: stage II sporulation protein M [Candidatus Woesearchaeota archaeon]|nr:MAG: stage II sporulation protein M [Candidatus Woesearchaeota archaeon]